jgi:para-aminobenzoate synthetase/4-amino-4-deoxychorismate lyase
VPFGALVECDDLTLVSLSPELFFRIDHGVVRSSPMKGTAPRGRFVDEDMAAAKALAASEKNRAENVMIVDLVRNDLTRVCEIGSVRAGEMFRVERYASVLQMVSDVEGQLRTGATWVDVFGALFPAGSITGAPKSSSMRLIAALEHAPRGVYCGAIGCAAPDGAAVFNVAIRTATFDRAAGTAEYGVGGGITWDSDARDEHAEAMSKAACLTVRAPFQLIETFRLDRGVAVRLDRHLDRMAASAAYFGWSFDRDAARARVDEEAGARPHDVRRARLLLDDEGRITIETRPLDVTPASRRVAVANEPIDARDRRFFHKTTDRREYDRRAAARPDVFDVLLVNARGELTEFTRGNVVVELDGARVTPVRASGLLNGVFRQELLDAGLVVERVVSTGELARASRIWFVNSLREWIDVTLAP